MNVTVAEPEEVAADNTTSTSPNASDFDTFTYLSEVLGPQRQATEKLIPLTVIYVGKDLILALLLPCTRTEHFYTVNSPYTVVNTICGGSLFTSVNFLYSEHFSKTLQWRLIGIVSLFSEHLHISS